MRSLATAPFRLASVLSALVIIPNNVVTPMLNFDAPLEASSRNVGFGGVLEAVFSLLPLDQDASFADELVVNERDSDVSLVLDRMSRLDGLGLPLSLSSKEPARFSFFLPTLRSPQAASPGCHLREVEGR